MIADKKPFSDKARSYVHLIQRLAMLLYHTKLYYGLDNPLVKSELSEVLAEIEKNSAKKAPLTFSVLGNTVFLNGEKLEILDGLSKQFINYLAKLSLGSLDLAPGLTLNELNTLMVLLINNAGLKGKEQVEKFLDEHNTKRIIPHLATYQLVHENEQIVKEGEVVNVNTLSSKIIKDFSSDLKHASPKDKTASVSFEETEKFLANLKRNVTEDKIIKINIKAPNQPPLKILSKDEQISKDKKALNADQLVAVIAKTPHDQEQNQPSLEVVKNFSSNLINGVIQDKTLVRDPSFLCRVLTDVTQTINTLEELSRIIWALGECLMNDISVAKEIETKHKILEQLNNHLLAQYEHKENNEQWKILIEESFVKIITALQTKKYLLLYKKHKKGLEVALKKIESLLKNAPEDNKLYHQIKDELKKIGAPKYDINMFT